LLLRLKDKLLGLVGLEKKILGLKYLNYKYHYMLHFTEIDHYIIWLLNNI
jgi:hypothetical protein